MSVTKIDIHKTIDQLPPEKLEMVAAYLERIINDEQNKQEAELHIKAFNYVMDNYSETIKGLVDR